MFMALRTTHSKHPTYWQQVVRTATEEVRKGAAAFAKVEEAAAGDESLARSAFGSDRATACAKGLAEMVRVCRRIEASAADAGAPLDAALMQGLAAAWDELAPVSATLCRANADSCPALQMHSG